MSSGTKLFINNVNIMLRLKDTEVTWTSDEDKEFKGTVPVDDIVAVRKVTDGIEVNFVDRLPEFIWRTKTVIFAGQENECVELLRDINNKIQAVSQRPARVLVVINPISGKMNGRETYTKTVEPLFRLSGIEADVIVSEYPGHFTKIINDYDLKSVNGIVLLGGDGTYFECMDALMKRTQSESNISYHDPDVNLKETDIPVALIATGTGNGVAVTCFGTKDIETAVLHIITGTQKRFNLLSVYNSQQLLAFAGSITSYGMYSDMLCQLDPRRELGFYRRFFPVFMNILVFNTPRLIEAEVQCRNTQSASSQHENTEHSTLDESANSWLIRGTFTNIVCFTSDFNDVDVPAKLELDGSSSTVKLCLFRPFSRIQILRHLYRLAKYAGNGFVDDFIQRQNITEFKVKLLADDILTGQETAASYISLDGERYNLTHPEFEMRLRPKIALVYASR